MQGTLLYYLGEWIVRSKIGDLSVNKDGVMPSLGDTGRTVYGSEVVGENDITFKILKIEKIV